MTSVADTATDLPATAAEAPKPAKPVIAFVPGHSRSTAIALQFPITVDGVEIDEITVSRLTGKQVSEMPEGMGVNEVYAIMAGVPVEVILALDAEDALAVLAVAQDFLPQRMKAETGPTGDTGTSTQHSSPES